MSTAQDPADCHICGRHAIGVGIGAHNNPKWVCEECVAIIKHVRAVKRLDPYEMKAREGGMDAAAPLVGEFGPDLSLWEEDQVLSFCGAVWKGCADRIRTLIASGEPPF